MKRQIVHAPTTPDHNPEEDRRAHADGLRAERRLRDKARWADVAHGVALRAELALLEARREACSRRLAEARAQQEVLVEHWRAYKIAASRFDRRAAGLRVTPGEII